MQISQPPNITQNWLCIQNFQMDLRFQEKKNGLEICFLVPKISNKYKRSIFLDILYHRLLWLIMWLTITELCFIVKIYWICLTKKTQICKKNIFILSVSCNTWPLHSFHFFHCCSKWLLSLTIILPYIILLTFSVIFALCCDNKRE